MTTLRRSCFGFILAVVVGGGAALLAAPAYGFHRIPDLSMQVYPVPIRSSEDWVLTQSWGGSGNFRSEEFEVEEPQFLLEWQAWQTMTTSIAGIPGLGLLQLEVHRVDADADTVVATVSA